ncbi:MAG: ATP-binding protein [Verrucomicrobiota bacterium]
MNRSIHSVKLGIGYYLVLLSFLSSTCNAFFYQESNFIKSEIQKLETELEQIPSPSLNLAPWTLGYRSIAFTKDKAQIEVTIDFDKAEPIDLVVLMPATYTENGHDLKVHCFPRRFLIESIHPDGTTSVIADHQHHDYEIQGIEPQLFHIPNPHLAIGLKLTVNRLAENKTWTEGPYRMALGELMAFAGNWNVALNQTVNSNSASDYSYIWTTSALVDGFSLFSPVSRNPKSPNEIPFRTRNTTQLEITFDLNQTRVINEYRFWPLVHDLQWSYPPSSGIGFPRGIQVQISSKPDFSDSLTILNHPEAYPQAGSNPLMYRTAPKSARYVRVTLSNIVPDYRLNITELALDEIQFFNQGQLVSYGSIATVEDHSISASDLKKLTDGRTTEGDILPLRQSLIDLSRYTALERSLKQLRRELELTTRQEKERTTFFVAIAIGLISILILMIGVVYLFSERRWGNIRERIACDIHDDLGANLISAAHSMELIQHSLKNASESQKRLLVNAIETTQRSAQDTRQIVRLLERDDSGGTWTDGLHEMLKAQAGGFPCKLRLDETRGFNELNKTRRWDLMLFIKEAVNNGIKHSNAQKIQVHLQKHQRRLRVTIADDGQGIAEEKLPIRHLESRAKQLKGNLKLKSHPGKGTQIILDL